MTPPRDTPSKGNPPDRDAVVAISRNVARKYTPGAETIAGEVIKQLDPEVLAEAARAKGGKWSRFWENLGFVAGLTMACAFGAAEIIVKLGIQIGNGKCQPVNDTPWIVVLLIFACIVPKMLGRKTAGEIWNKLPIGGKTA